MKLSGATFSSMLLAVLGIGLTAGTDVISNHQAVNQVVATLSALALVGLIGNQLWPQPVGALIGRLKSRSEPQLPDGFISLREAADRLLDETLGMELRSMAISHGGKTLNGAWAWLGMRMAERGLTIYGRHPATKIMHAIPADHFKVAGLRGGAAEMVRDGFTTYTHLAVRRTEFEARLDDLKRAD